MYLLVEVSNVPPRPQDPYGHYKLACEEALSYYRRKEDGFPWVSLR